MKNIQKAAAIFATAISIAALLLATTAGGLMFALLGMLGPAGSASEPLGSALGAGVLLLYACGAALGIAAFRWPVQAGIALLPLGVCAFALGGPIAKLYGVLIFLTGVVVLAKGRNRHRA